MWVPYNSWFMLFHVHTVVGKQSEESWFPLTANFSRSWICLCQFWIKFSISILKQLLCYSVSCKINQRSFLFFSLFLSQRHSPQGKQRAVQSLLFCLLSFVGSSLSTLNFFWFFLWKMDMVLLWGSWTEFYFLKERQSIIAFYKKEE